MNRADALSDMLALGTAQLGQPYGVANRAGQPDEAGAHEILDAAWRSGIRHLDTAQAYGTSEEIIGRYMRRHPETAGGELKVLTKLHPDADTEDVDTWLKGSSERLGPATIWGMLLHREGLLERWKEGLGDALGEWRGRGFVRHLGVSVATTEGMAQAIEMPDLRIIQAPAGPFDRRMHRAGLLARAEARGKRLFLRSVFLQGVVLMAPQEAARRLPFASGIVECFDAFCAERHVDRRRFAIGYARRRAPGAVLVIGADAPAQVQENCSLALADPIAESWCAEWDAAWPDDDPILVDPSRWLITGSR